MTQREITSLQHPLVKHLVRLRQSRDYRYESKRVLLSGRKLIKELSSTIRIRTLFLENGASPSINAEETFFVTPEILKKVTGLENPEPIAAEIDMPDAHDLSSVKFLLILDGISDPGNLGTLIRTARALGWDGVFLTPGSTDLYNEKALRAAKGATFTLPWKCGTVEELSALLQNNAMMVLGADATGTNIAECKISTPLALILGNESHGIVPELQKIAQSIAIPMMGRMESINVASAGAILMYELKELSLG